MAEMSKIATKTKRKLLGGLLAAVRGLTVPIAAAVVAAVPLAAVADGPVTAAAESTIAVDLREDVCRAVDTALIGYSPNWCGVAEAGAYVVIEKVVRAGMSDAVTNTLATLAADAEGTYPLVVGASDEHCVRLIHRVYSPGGAEIGEPLVRDVEFGYRSAAGAAFVADSRTNTLQLAASARKPIDLAYSTAWATNAAAVSISAVQLSGRGGVPVATNSVFAASADAEGTTTMRTSRKGWWRLLCQVEDDSGDTLLEYLTEDFKMPGGIVMNFK